MAIHLLTVATISAAVTCRSQLASLPGMKLSRLLDVIDDAALARTRRRSRLG